VLIVNADDLGATPSATDPAIECFDAGALTSATAMVWMHDSGRAARLARERALPVGLHLNLTLPFADPSAPADVRSRQLALTGEFDRDSWRRSARGDLAEAEIARSIEDQLERFSEQFGQASHLDGHHHVHVHPAVLAQLPRSLPIRPPLAGAERRTLGQRWLRRRFRGADTCLPFQQVHPALGGDIALLDAARHRVVEVMVHPALPQEREALLSAEWRAALARLPLGSYRDLT
jgi:chitin disaccharide deacetylase